MSAKKLTTSQFIERSSIVHNNKYSYPHEYTGSRDLISIICPAHGEYKVRAYSHLSGTGCKRCDVERRSAQHTLTNQQFINQAHAVHGDRYLYCDNYTHSQERITIICPDHGPFIQMPTSHLRGAGCQRCHCQRKVHPRFKLSGGHGMYSECYFTANPSSKTTPAHFYVVRITVGTDSLIKVGITKNISNRLLNYNKHSGVMIYLLALPLYEAFLLELDATKALAPYRYLGTTHFVGHTECFRDTTHVNQYLTYIQETHHENITVDSIHNLK